MSVTRDDIVREAVELLKQDGLDALSLRKLAARLKITAPTLYWHVANKRELLDLVAEELVRAQRETQLPEPPPGQPWWDWLRLRLWDMFDALITIRDAPRVLAGNRPRLESLSHIDQTLKTLMDAGLPPADAQQALFTLGSYVVGSAIEWQAEADRAREGIGIDAEVVTAIKSGEFPHIEIAMRGVNEQPPEATFGFGLDLLIDALRARYAPDHDRDTPLSVES
ncbi:TetR/AcrR family transcriptional regulator C-terminal domain-containing protein [Stackebrandtia nassauensis]|uniref:Transcriptional regulator, TetR family n=1 Tax=Stackebrandtia nassauensis (strain DSM 44728 / CIP 108903 / NRRL B-16338 / NBRC 102104 / LLR-40K-21) TaxID=446470 RepID=D3QAU4_STANL|nr:TetR/AcrR family transcriptional regulator C-terminal domain-containing protein [Stackebrandtia nassauensis]ADD44740.1 transcriptional regulator, TetR family [Stackebrandtia nassauensis DSM 44728]